MIVLAVWAQSQYGILKKSLQTEQDKTPLQAKLKILAYQIGKVGMYSAIATFICMLGHIINEFTIKENFFLFTF